METNDNENTTLRNLWGTAKAVLRGKYTAVQAFPEKQERSQIHNLHIHLKKLEKNNKESLNPTGEEI